LVSRQNRVIGICLLLLIVLAWIQLFGGGPAAVMALHQAHHAHLTVNRTAPPSLPWNLREVGIVFLMWLVMAVAMMLPTAAPAILLFADVARAGEHTNSATVRITAFILGYLLAWWGVGALATAVQLRLAAAGLCFSAFSSERTVLGGAVLIAAGLYQFSALKESCLRKCRSPMTFFLAQWRDGVAGAIYLGLRHSIDCIGCCWALMALMLFSGTMSIAWTAGLSAVMLMEKVAPGGRIFARAVGIALIFCGGALVASAVYRGEVL
jgi:predicted metal-binding membrane protein